MKNYYEILEVDKKASPEVIDKAYKTLVKKYHPDLQDDKMHVEYEEKMKEINEAYSILSDEYKKTNYDEQLHETMVSIEEYQRVLLENQQLKAQLENKNPTSSNIGSVIRENMKQATAKAYQDAYQDAYVQDMKNRGYTIKYKHDLKYYFKLIIYIAIIVLIGILIYQIPPVKSYFTSLYNGNVYFKAIVDIFKNTIQSGF